MKEPFDNDFIDTMFQKVYDMMPQHGSLYQNPVAISGIFSNRDYLYGWASLNEGILRIRCEKDDVTYNYTIGISSMLFYLLIEAPDSTMVKKLDVQQIEVCDNNIQLILSNGGYLMIDFVSDADNKEAKND